MTDSPDIKDVDFSVTLRKMELQEGDIIVITVPSYLSQAVLNMLGQQVQKTVEQLGIDGVKSLMIPEGITIAELTDEQLDELGLMRKPDGDVH